METADLFSIEDASVADWWQSLLESYQEYDAEKTKQIGDIGEKLTIQHERRRLGLDGIEGLHARVKWVARFSSDYGYDILSVRGSFFRDKWGMLDPIQVEVKSSTIAAESSFSFKVTRNEWNTAQTNPDSYFFYCWVGVSLTSGTASKGPFVIPAASLVSSFPIDRSNICEWTECRLVVDLVALSIS